jgi:hypothetical protein
MTASLVSVRFANLHLRRAVSAIRSTKTSLARARDWRHAQALLLELRRLAEIERRVVRMINEAAP